MLNIKKEQFKYLHSIMMLKNTSINYFIFFASHYRKCKHSIIRAQKKEGELRKPETQN